MRPIPRQVSEFLEARRIAVAGVSRERSQPANAIFRRLRDTGHEVVPVNPAASVVEGQSCFADLASLPQPVDAVMIVTPPAAGLEVVRQALEKGITRIWFHRSFGDGSVSPEAVELCRKGGVEPIVGGCPMMYCGKVDAGHRCFRWLLNLRHRIPG